MQCPTRFGQKYMLLERISTGGMSEVYRANATGPNGFSRAVAIKCILPHLTTDSSFTDMFIDEAKISAQLHHPHICQIYDFGRIEESYFLAMEHVEGQSLRMVQERFHGRRIRVPQALALFIVSELCDALDYAHGLSDRTGRPLSIVHRDIKPQNVLISYQGEVKLIDFGIAKASDRLTATRERFKGTFSYMAPEQVTAGIEVDHRVDIFAVGLILHELLTGKRVYGGGGPAMVDAIREARIAPPSSERRSLTEDLDAIVMRALARDRDERYQRAGDLKSDIEEYRLAWGHLCRRSDIAAMMEELFEHEIEQHQRHEARLAAMANPVEETVTVPGPAAGPDDEEKTENAPSWQEDRRRSSHTATSRTRPSPRWRSFAMLATGLLCLFMGVAAAGFAIGLMGRTPASAVLHIASTPPGAHVEVRNSKRVLVRARAPLALGGLVTGRRYRVRATLDGRPPLERELVWHDGTTST